MRAFIFIIASFCCLSSFADGRVRIVSSQWGDKDVTKEASFCNGLRSCQYTVSSRFLGRPTGDKIFSITWQCHDQTQTLQSKTIRGNSEGAIINMDCSADPVVGKMKKSLVHRRRSLNIAGCSEESVVKAEDSPELRYFKSLYARKDASIEEYLQLWYPNEGEEYEGAYFFSCESDQTAGQDLKGPCKHDVFYSWGPEVKLKSMKSVMKDGENWSGSPNPGARVDSNSLFMTLTPASTMNFGPVGVRIRLKKTTKLMISSIWSPGQGVVSMSPFGDDYEDVVINDASAIESWSYGTSEQYDEIIRDIKRMASGEKARFYAGFLHDFNAQGLYRIYSDTDGYPLYEKELKERLHSLIGMILNGEGRIHYQKGSCRNRSQFFATDKPSYFNPS